VRWLGREAACVAALAIGCTLTVTLYLAMVWTLGQFGVRL
jgi:hypothetical protein